MTEFIASLLFILLAEMGDKTQLLAMAFATKYNPYKVLIGIFFATILTHAMAVFVGHFLSAIIPLEIISFIAALSFIAFGLWTIRGDKLEKEEKKESKFGPILTVGIAFFLAEMGDKTQLATVSLAVEYQKMFFVLMGSSLGMIAADGLSIIVGLVLKKHIPEKMIKWISASIFVLFGLIGIYKILSLHITFIFTCLILFFIMIVTGLSAFYFLKKD